jgi:hypothetical protein
VPSREQLVEEAEAWGLSVPSRATKTQIQALIDAAATPPDYPVVAEVSNPYNWSIPMPEGPVPLTCTCRHHAG